MKKRLLTILLITSYFLLATVFLANKTLAQKADLNIGISPPLTHIVIRPGKTALTTVTLENQGAFDVNLTPNFVDFTSDNKTGIPVLGDSMTFPYISLQDDAVHLNSPYLLKTGQSKQLVFEVALPENSLEKEYHFSLVFSVDPVQNALHDLNETAVTGQVVTNFIVTVSQTAKDQGVIQLQSFEAPLITDSLAAIDAKVFMQNSGKNTTVTLGNFKIANALGKEVYAADLLPENILPGAARQVFGAQSVTKENEGIQVEQPLHYKGLFLIGPYTLTITYHAPGQEPQTFTHTLFALPISILIFLLLVSTVYFTYTKTRLFQGKNGR